MVISLSFDDGRVDQYNAYKILKENNLKASFHIDTGFIDGSFVTDTFSVGRLPLSIEQIVEMSEYGMDISSHGDRHIMDSNDFKVSIEKLNKWIPNKTKFGFSVPNSDFDDNKLKAFIEDNKFHLSYVRVGRSKKCYNLLSKVNYVLYRVLHWQLFFNSFNRHNLIKKVDKDRINALVIKDDTKLKSVIKFIEKNKDKNVLLVIMFHSIMDAPTDPWEWSTNNFKELVKYLSNGISVKTLEEIVNGQ